MFMPGWKPEPAEPKDAAMMFKTMAHMQRKLTPEERQAAALSGQLFKERQCALKEAKARGASRDELKQIMGVISG